MKHRNDKFILNAQGEPVPEPSSIKWADWFEDNRTKRVVKQEWVGNVRISTVFLGLNHNWITDGPPILWETMTFSNSHLGGEMDRCSGGREQAEAMHNRMVEKIKRALKRDD